LEIGPNGSLTINAAQSVSSGTIQLDGGTLTDSSGIIFGGNSSASNGFLTGIGTVAANLSLAAGSTSTGSTITAKGNGTLDLTGTVGSGLVLALDPSGSTLKIDGTAVSGGAINTASQTALGNGDTLEIGANGNLTIGAAESIVGSGAIQLDGGTLTDAAGITLAGTNGGAAPTLSGSGTIAAQLTVVGNGLVQLSGGTLTDSSGITFSQGGFLKGHGTVAAPLSGGRSDGFILATNGTLELASTVNVHTLELGDNSNSSGEILKLDAASSTQFVEFNGSGQTLEIGPNGSLSIGAGALAIGPNKVQLDGPASTLTDASGVSLAGGNITGAGNLSASTKLSGYGTVGIPLDSADTVTANGGTLELFGTVDATTASTFHIANTLTSVLKFDGSVGTSAVHPTIIFDGSEGGQGLLDLTSTTLANFHAVVAGLDEGEGIKVAGAASASLNDTSSTLTVYSQNGTSLGSIALATSYAGDTFNVTGGVITVNDLAATLGSTTAAESTPIDVTVTDDGVPVTATGYQWQISLDGGTTWANATGNGANASAYTPTEDDETGKLRVLVTYSEPTGSENATSNVTNGVLDKAPTITTPTISGPAQEGQTLSAAVHPASITYDLNISVGTGTIKGWIQTDAHLGVLSQADITNADVTLTDGSRAFTVAGAQSFSVFGSDLTATPNGLSFNFGGTDGGFGTPTFAFEDASGVISAHPSTISLNIPGDPSSRCGPRKTVTCRLPRPRTRSAISGSARLTVAPPGATFPGQHPRPIWSRKPTRALRSRWWQLPPTTTGSRHPRPVLRRQQLVTQRRRYRRRLSTTPRRRRAIP
jgi:hypothetical protein